MKQAEAASGCVSVSASVWIVLGAEAETEKAAFTSIWLSALHAISCDERGKTELALRHLHASEFTASRQVDGKDALYTYICGFNIFKNSILVIVAHVVIVLIWRLEHGIWVAVMEHGYFKHHLDLYVIKFQHFHHIAVHPLELQYFCIRWTQTTNNWNMKPPVYWEVVSYWVFQRNGIKVDSSPLWALCFTVTSANNHVCCHFLVYIGHLMNKAIQYSLIIQTVLVPSPIWRTR